MQLISDFRPDIIMVHAVLHAGDRRRDRAPGHRPDASTSLKVGIFGAEPWTDGMRARDRGARSASTPSTSTACPKSWARASPANASRPRTGLHIWEDHFYPEIIDPETGEVLPDGEKGELVFTSLTKEALPIIRYRTRDLTRLLPRHGAHHAPHGARSPAAPTTC